MKLATIPNGTRDGELVIVSSDLSKAVSAKAIAPNLLTAIENWPASEPWLLALAEDLAAGKAANVFAFDQAAVLRRCRARSSGSTVRASRTISG